MDAPLQRVAVVELGGEPAIGYAGRLFADLGADVMRVEWKPVANEAGAQTQYGGGDALALYLARGKKTIAIGPSGNGAKDGLSRLLAQGHVVLCGPEQHPAGLETDPRTIAAAFPHLVVVSVTPFGLEGGACARAADDLTLQAYGGIAIGIGLPGQPPLKLPGNQTAFQAGLSAAIAAMGTLFSRHGALIDVSAADVWASFYSGVDVALAHFGRRKKQRAGHRASGQPYPRTIYRCKDGYFAIQCGESRHWQSFLHMLGRDDLLTHPLFANRFQANDRYGDECDAIVETWFLSRTKEDILQQCLTHKIPGAPVYEIHELGAHPHLLERKYFIDLDTQRGSVKCPGDPYMGLTRPAVAATGAALSPPPGPASPAPQRTAGRAGNSTKTRPLAGLRVVDFGWVWAGAVPGHILADMGAEVIKIESAAPLDYMRQGRPIIGTQKDPEQNPMFQNVNRGKLSLRIKLDHPEARAVLKDLVAVSDVVIENFSPGVMEKFGLAYPDLQKVRPDLVMCSMSAVGQNGPLRGLRTYATMIASLAGLDSLVGYPGGRVLGSQSSYADPNASLHAAFGILGALWRRRQRGIGAYIDLSQWETAVNVMAEQVVGCGLNHPADGPTGTLHGTKVPHGNYPAAGDDRWIAISVGNEDEWQALKKALGDPEWMSQQTFATAADRHANRAALDARLAGETLRHDHEVLASALSAAGVPAAPLLDASQLAASDHFLQRQLFETVEHPVLGSLPVYRLPWHVDGAPVPITRRAPLLGEHTDYVLAEVLSYSQARIAALAGEGLFS